jgi:hemerythrin-like domain-containing protein
MTNDLPRVMQQLIRDHGNMTRLLDVLQGELDSYRAGRTIDFEVVTRIVDYILNFPELRHHPREDLVFRHLAARDAASGRRVETILAEHREMAALTRKFAAALRNLQSDLEMPRPWLESLFATFIATNRAHMRREEEVYFPLAMLNLTAADWQKIDAQAGGTGDDPLFGGRVDAEYQALHDRILRLAG